jgi:hypothetical protein
VSEHNDPVKHNWFIRWKHTAVGRLCWLVLDIVIVYIFGSMAVDSGRLLEWGVAILFAIDAVYNLVRLIGKLIKNGNKEAAA